MSERDDMIEQSYHVPTPPAPWRPDPRQDPQALGDESEASRT